MRRLAFIIATLLATAAGGETLKSLAITRPAAGVTAVQVKAGIGDVEITGDGNSEVAVSVRLTTRGGGMFGNRPSTSELDAIEIDQQLVGGELTLSLRPERRDDSHLSERWTVRVPAALAATVKLGVGDVRILDLSGDVSAKVGVGDVRVEGLFRAFGPIRAASGVGDVTLRTPDGHTDGTGFISHTLHGRGPGRGELEAKAGVGDVTIRLR